MRIARLPRHAVLCVAILVAASCSRTSPVSPDVSSPISSQVNGAVRSGLQPAAGDAVFPLVAGSFSIENGKGDRIEGSYVGTVQYRDGTTQTSALTLLIADGSGAFAGAAGTITLEGTGGFIDEGAFLLDGRGEVTLAGGRRTVLVLSLRGTSTAACSSSDRIAIFQSAAGAMAHAGRVTAVLSHEVENTGCSS